ncbi:MAG: Fic family protein [Oscillospiraceae bacterium]|nr:Fic family protein [Oscillospiraceae bacterium]
MSKYSDAVKLWQSYHIKTDADISLRLDNFKILFAYHSGKIENDAVTYHDTREIFENGRVLNYTGDPRAVFEMQNQRLCHEFLKPKLASREPLSVGLIKDVHAVLTGGTYDERRYIAQGERPGEFKKHDYVTGRAEVGSKPEHVERDLTELLDEFADFDGDILKAAAYFHARFEYIHPFADGNGRVGRAALNYFLMLCGHPPLIIHDEDKRDYYDALEKYDTAEDITPMTEFLRKQTEKTWEKTLERNL